MQVYYDNLLKEMYDASDKAHAMFESESQIKIFFFISNRILVNLCSGL